jgi:hypothetical protein
MSQMYRDVTVRLTSNDPDMLHYFWKGYLQVYPENPFYTRKSGPTHKPVQNADGTIEHTWEMTISRETTEGT